MTGFYMKYNFGLKWVKVDFQMNLYYTSFHAVLLEILNHISQVKVSLLIEH